MISKTRTVTGVCSCFLNGREAAIAAGRVPQKLVGFQPEARLAHPDLTSGHVDQLDQRWPYRLQ